MRRVLMTQIGLVTTVLQAPAVKDAEPLAIHQLSDKHVSISW